MRPKAVPVRRIENEVTIVTEWQFEKDAETGWHRHEYDYLVMPRGAGRLLIESAEGEAIAELSPDNPYFRQAGVEHNVVNATGASFAFVEVEFKRR
ncbi:cupin domain-containing protein [Futiania mangrovi]|uniref:Cupin n=1 Tax=Futiania mangrovi TaxID=2959716 RepID=A0A9J6PCH6_9PROT|nr:cupin [Futiania mangrovii]MCP1337932.1 cupin [Futiania mangrovii]